MFCFYFWICKTQCTYDGADTQDLLFINLQQIISPAKPEGTLGVISKPKAVGASRMETCLDFGTDSNLLYFSKERVLQPNTCETHLKPEEGLLFRTFL